jgi:hypothetical protein
MKRAAESETGPKEKTVFLTDLSEIAYKDLL